METYILKTKDFGVIIEQTYFKKQERIFKGGHSTEEEKEKASRSRAVSKIKEAVYCNNFKYFFTLTIKDETRYDIEKAIKLISSSINYYKKLAKNKGFDFKFVYVFELTKNKGVHLHGFFDGFFDLYENKYGHLSSLYFDNIGFQNFLDANKVNPNYLIKYINKNPTYINHLYHVSRGLKKALVFNYHDYFNKFIDLPFTFKNKFVKMTTFTR